MKQHLQHPIFQVISELADKINQETYVIGGFVRDLILNRPSPDIDVVTIGSGIQLAEMVAKKLGPNIQVSVFKNFGTAMLKYQSLEVEFVGARKESYNEDSRKPIVEDGTLSRKTRIGAILQLMLWQSVYKQVILASLLIRFTVLMI